MLILGLDVATKTGFAYYPHPKMRDIQTGSFVCRGETPEQKAASLSRFIKIMWRDYGRPDFVAIEQPLRNVKQFRKGGTKMMPDLDSGLTVNAGSALLLNQLVGSVVGVIDHYGIPWDVVTPQSWRKAFFPAGTKAQDRADWKRLAKWQCETLKIDVSNADQAEAVGIAFWAPTSQVYRNLQNRSAAA